MLWRLNLSDGYQKRSHEQFRLSEAKKVSFGDKKYKKSSIVAADPRPQLPKR